MTRERIQPRIDRRISPSKEHYETPGTQLGARRGGTTIGYNLDTIDRAILQAFQDDARITNKELAAKVHLSPSSCHDRVRRLREVGALAGFTTRVDPSALGIGLQAMIGTRLRDHTSENLEAFQAYVLDFEEVVALHHVTGAKDYFLRVAVRDADHLRQLVVAISARTELERLETFVILHERVRPLPDLTES